jgi:hypothetical protein
MHSVIAEGEVGARDESLDGIKVKASLEDLDFGRWGMRG